MRDLELAGRLLHKLAAGESPSGDVDSDIQSEPAQGGLAIDVVTMFDALVATDFDVFAAIVTWAHDA